MNLQEMSLTALKDKLFKLFENISSLVIVSALYVASLTSLIFFPKHHWHITSFNKIIGTAAINDYDVGKLVTSFYGYFLLLAVVFVLSLMLFRQIYEAIDIDVEARCEKITALASLGLVLNIVQFVSIGSGRISIGTALYAISFIVAVGCLLRGITLHDITRGLVAAMSLCLPVGLILSYFVKDALVLYPVAYLISLLCVSCTNRFFSERAQDKLYAIAVTLPLITFFFIEVLHIAAQHSFVFARPYRNYLVLISIVVVTACLPLSKLRIELSQNKACIISLLGLSLLMVQRGFYFYGNADLFEAANSSVLISDFFNFGTLPIVSHFGGHMLSGVLEGILYGLITGDHYGAIFSPYGGYLLLPCLSLLLYVLFKHLFDDSLIAFFVAIFFPYSNMLRAFGLGLVIAIATSRFVEENSWKATVWLVLAMVACCLYRLDLGYSFSLAAILVAAWFVLIKEKAVDWCSVWCPLFIMALLLLLLWVFLCWQQGAHPYLRLREFLAICASNPNWALTSLGNRGLMAFGWAYLLMPLACVSALFFLLMRRENYRPPLRFATVVVAVLGFAYFTNFTRGLVRHSIVEMSFNCTVWCGYLFLACFVGLTTKKKWLIFPVLIGLFITNGLLRNNSSYPFRPLIQHAAQNNFNITRGWMNRESNGNTFMKNLQMGVHSNNRLRLSGWISTEVSDWKRFFDKVLSPDETYLDFTNHSFMYSAMGRRNPVYAAQSPGHLSGDFAQSMFIKEISEQKAKIPLAFLPSVNRKLSATLDGVSNVIRYYKVAEYIYQNYRPFVALNDYRVWVLNERYDEFLEKVFGSDSSKPTKREALSQFVSNPPDCFNCNLITKDDRIVVHGMTKDPILDNVQKTLKLEKFIGRRPLIRIRYKSNNHGFVQLFYANARGESYSENRSLKCDSSTDGEVTFLLPFSVSANTRLRLDTPAFSIFEITSIAIEEPTRLAKIDYGYDQANLSFHRYHVHHLPRVWGDFGLPQTESVEMTVVRQSNVYRFSPKGLVLDKRLGNYVVLSIDSTTDSKRNAMDLVARGKDGLERFRYQFSLEKGNHKYAFRVSSDYWWYADDITFELKGAMPYQLRQALLKKGD